MALGKSRGNLQFLCSSWHRASICFFHWEFILKDMSVPHSHFRPGRPGAYSVNKTLKPVSFVCIAPEAKNVTLVGDFNDWEPSALPLKRQPDGSWTGQVTLGHGHHHYQFLIDGKPTLDPRAQGIARNEQNEKVSLISVS